MRITTMALRFVTTGLDPVVHSDVDRAGDARLRMRHVGMDCRVKPGNDA
jgi:hypothetical protein